MKDFSKLRPGFITPEHKRHEFVKSSQPSMRSLREGKAFALKMITSRPMTELEIIERAKAVKGIDPVTIVVGIAAMEKVQKIHLKQNRYHLTGE